MSDPKQPRPGLKNFLLSDAGLEVSNKALLRDVLGFLVIITVISQITNQAVSARGEQLLGFFRGSLR